jgi:ribosome-binding factor A
MPSSRPERVGDQIRVEITGMLSRQVHDPGIGFLTVTRVEVSADLQHARVYYTTLGDDKARRESARALERASPFLRRQLAGRLRLRRAPELLFFFDESVERHDRVERILREIQQERDSAPLESDERATPPPGQAAAPATPDPADPRDPHEPADTAHHEREEPH